MKKGSFNIHFIFLLLIFSSINLIAQGWNPSLWAYRSEVTILNPGATVLTDYQVKIELDSSFDFTSAKSNGSDIRVADYDETTLLPFWIEEWNPAQDSAVIWVRVPSIPITGITVYLYYGNNAASSLSSGTNTFKFFDDFSNGSYIGKWGPGFTAHDWKSSSEMLHGVLEYAYYNRVWGLHLDSLDIELEQEFDYIHSQINQTTGQVLSDPGGYLTSEPEYCYGLILSNLAVGNWYYTQAGNSTMLSRCYDDMVLVFDYLSTTYPTVVAPFPNDHGGYGWLLLGFSNAWRSLNDQGDTRTILASTIVQSYSDTLISSQNVDGSWNGAIGVQEQLKRDLGLLFAHQIGEHSDTTYLFPVKKNLDYILSTYWNPINGGLESYENPSASDRFLEYNQELFMVATRRLAGRSSGVYDFTAKGEQAWKFLTDYNYAGIDMYVDNYTKNNTFFSYSDMKEDSTVQNVGWKGSEEIGTAIWGMVLNYTQFGLDNYQSSHSTQPYNYLDMILKQIKKSPANGGYFSTAGNWIRELDWTVPTLQPNVTLWSKAGNPTVSIVQDNSNPVASFTGNGSYNNYLKSNQNYDNFILEMNVKMTVDANDNCTPEIGFRIADDDNRYITMLRGNANNDLFIRRYYQGTPTDPPTYSVFDYNNNQYYKYKIAANSNTIQHYLDDVLISTWNDVGSTITNGVISLANLGGSITNPVYFDDVRVRSFAVTEPTTTVGPRVSNPLPVELSSLSAVIIGSSVKLSWRTETEVNNYGFEVERCALSAERQAWNKIGFVNGNGNSNSPKDYVFEDNSLTPSRYSYRLKQIDNDGQFEYSKAIEVDFNSPNVFELSQNYPNPFNPATSIKYQVSSSSLVTLKVYDVLGNEVATLVDEYKPAGSYEVEFKSTVGSHQLASGVYYYQLRAWDPSTSLPADRQGSGQVFVETKKMILLK